MKRNAPILALLLARAAHGFVAPSRTMMLRRPSASTSLSENALLPSSSIFKKEESPNYRKISKNTQMAATSTDTSTPEAKMDDLLESGKLKQAIELLQSTESLDIDRERWQRIFDAIEVRTAEAEENSVNTRAAGDIEYPLISPARMEMTNMYDVLKQKDHLKLFGASAQIPPAAGSKTVTPILLEQITGLSMKSLTPKPTPTLLIAGIVLALLEGLVSVTAGISFNLLVSATLLFTVFDKLFANGAIFESFVKLFSPGISEKITRHEAGHFLAAYLMGCPVEGCVLSAWAALQDARFDKRSVSAGTSFFDPALSREMNSQKVTRSSVDRYSVIVMGGIAAEALQYKQADGGAGDEMALVAFLSQLNANSNTWNDTTIRNQARWGALQAVLLLKHYKPCYEALVDALERGGTLGDCIHAIEKAGRDNNLGPLNEPLGFILDQGPYGEWTTEAPVNAGEPVARASVNSVAPSQAPDSSITEEESINQLQEYKAQVEKRLQEIDNRIKELD